MMKDADNLNNPLLTEAIGVYFLIWIQLLRKRFIQMKTAALPFLSMPESAMNDRCTPTTMRCAILWKMISVKTLLMI